MPPTRSLVLLTLALCGCGEGAREFEITEQRAVARGDLKLGADSLARFGYVRQEEPARALEWDCPAGWKELPSTQFRLANFQVPGEVQCYLTVLPGQAGGVLMNLNRWRDQVGAEALTEAAVGGLPRLAMLGGQAVRMDVTGKIDGQAIKLIGTVLQTPQNMIFVKMLGAPAAVDAQETGLVQFIASVRRPGQPAQASPPGSKVDTRLKWQVPTGWQVGPARPMRVVTVLPPGEQGVECYVAVLGAEAHGVRRNVNRWRDQFGLPELDAAAVAALPKRAVLGQQATVVEVQGDQGDGEISALLGIVCELPERSVFVKLVGPVAAVQAARAEFFKFVDSLAE